MQLSAKLPVILYEINDSNGSSTNSYFYADGHILIVCIYFEVVRGMLLFFFLTLLGFLVSFVIYSLLFLNIIAPPTNISAALNIGLLVLISLRVIATKKMRQGNTWFYDISIKNLCPHWMKISTWIIMGYGIIFGLISLIKFILILVPALNGTIPMNETEYIIAMKNLFNSVFLFLMACYCFEAMLNYSYRILKKTKDLDFMDRWRME